MTPDQREEARKLIEETSLKIVEDVKKSQEPEIVSSEEVKRSYSAIYNWLSNSVPKAWKKYVDDEYIGFMKETYTSVLDKLHLF